jgi:ABC-type polysaccharide/polyol phosphate export permease
LQAVLVAPASRAALVLGKTLGGVAIALAQAAVFLALAPLAGFDARTIEWPLLAALLLFIGIGLSSMGFAIAWWLDSTQGYHIVMSVLLIPLWIVSGAMFPMTGGPKWIAILGRANPMSYGVAGVRRALYGGAAPGGLPTTAALELGVTLAFALAMVLLAVAVCSRRGDKP